MSEPQIVIHRNAELLAGAVAARIITRLVDVQSADRVPHLVLTGGTIADKIHAALAESPARDAVEWSRVELWWGDERYLPAGDPDRNETQVREALLDHLALDPTRVHPMPADDGSTDVDAAAESYAELLAAAGTPTDHGEPPIFDVVMLGVGPDGHVASLFPEHAGLHDERVAIGVHGSPKPPPTRLSLTFPTLNRADDVWFVASGDGKAKAVRMALSGAGRMQVPAAGVSGRHRTIWLLDAEAAGELPKGFDRSASH